MNGALRNSTARNRLHPHCQPGRALALNGAKATSTYATAMCGGIVTRTARLARMVARTDMLEAGIKRLREQRAYAERQMAELQSDTAMRVSKREMLVAHWAGVRDDCIDCLNVLYSERDYRELKRRGIL